MIAVFCALDQELSCLKKTVKITGTNSQGTCHIFEGKCGANDVLLVLTGVGKNRALRAAEYVTEKYQIDFIVSTGFCGALDHDAKPGDLAVYSRIKYDEPSSAKQEIITIAKSLNGVMSDFVRYSILTGDGVTVDKECATLASKSTLAKRSDCRFVDMESYWIGMVARRKNIPIAVVRPVFDLINDDITPITRMMKNGKINVSRAIIYILLHPGKIHFLTRYYSVYRSVRENMIGFMTNFLGAKPI